MISVKPTVKTGNPESNLITSLRIAIPLSIALWIMIIMLAKIFVTAA